LTRPGEAERQVHQLVVGEGGGHLRRISLKTGRLTGHLDRFGKRANFERGIQPQHLGCAQINSAAHESPEARRLKGYLIRSDWQVWHAELSDRIRSGVVHCTGCDQGNTYSRGRYWRARGIRYGTRECAAVKLSERRNDRGAQKTKRQSYSPE